MLRVYTLVCSLTLVLVSGAADYCYEDKCRCDGHKADCRYNDDKLTFIPKFPPEITSVDFSFNALGGIYSADFFSNVTNVTSLRLISTGLTYIHPGAFDHLDNLQSLGLSFNAFRRLPRDTFGQETRKRLVHFDVSQNQFDCGRDLLWLAEWKIFTPSVFQNNIDESYGCYNNLHGERDMMIFACEKYRVCKPRNILLYIAVSILIVAVVLEVTFLTCLLFFSRKKGEKYTKLQSVDVETAKLPCQ